MGKQMMTFGTNIQLDLISKLGDSLEKIDATIKWEIFREPIKSTYEKKIMRKAEDRQ